MSCSVVFANTSSYTVLAVSDDLLLYRTCCMCITGVILGTFVLSYMGNSAINFIMTNGNKLLARYKRYNTTPHYHESHSMQIYRESHSMQI
jgi:hypothetical protein